VTEDLPPWGSRLIAEFNARDKLATSLAQGLSPHQLNWQPQAGSWSIGQCLEHLSIGNEMYCRAISDALTQRATGAVEEIRPKLFGRMFLRNYIEPSAKTRRVTAPKVVRPTATSKIDLSILDRFIRTSDEARELVERARNHDVNRIRFKNPFVPIMNFTVGAAFEIVSKHDLRHLLQAERVRKSPEFPRD
jgi:hypothetical protein